MDHIIDITYSRLFLIYLEKHETVTDNPLITIHVNKQKIELHLNKDRVLSRTFEALKVG